MMNCPSCGTPPGAVGVTGGHLCPTCMHREGVVWPSPIPTNADVRLKQAEALLRSELASSKSKTDHGGVSTCDEQAIERFLAGGA